MSTSRGHSGGELSRTTVRRRARERALGLLYEAEVKAATARQILAGLPVPPDPYAIDLAVGVEAELLRIDGLIAKHSTGWALDRLPAVDRQLLRISVFELLEREEVPVAVVIDEAVELAKEFSTEESPRFVNGVLAAIAAEVRPEASAGVTLKAGPRAAAS